MLIADSQVHIWAPNTPERPWVAGRHPHRTVALSKDDLLREINAAGVNRVVLVPPGVEGTRNDLALTAARLHPDRFAVMGIPDFKASDARDRIATWRQQPGMLGLRFSFKGHGGPPDWLWSAAEKAGVPFMLSVAPAHMDGIEQVARDHPGLKLVIDHLALSVGKKDEEAFADLDRLLALAKHSNIAVKASSLPSHTADAYPYRRLHPYIRRVYDAFGPRRIFWGTDFSRLPCSYAQAITMFTEEIPWFTPEDKEWIMGRGLCEWIGWKLP